MTEQDEIWERDDMIVALRARVEKLEAALKEISEFVRTAYSPSGKDDREFPSEEAAIALAALKDKP